jgi:hypothetical protein
MISKLENHDFASLDPGIHGFLVRVYGVAFAVAIPTDHPKCQVG